MPDTEARVVLKDLLAECPKCSDIFYENVALICDDDGNLTDEQVEAVADDLRRRHAQHVH